MSNFLEPNDRPRWWRFDIFKGAKDNEGRVHRIKSVGSAYLVDGKKTYTIRLKTLLHDVFYLLPDEKKLTTADFVILTREPSRNPRRKYFWHNVGSGAILTGENSGFVQLSLDLFGSNDIYMNLYPKESTYETQVTKILKEEVLLPKAA